MEKALIKAVSSLSYWTTQRQRAGGYDVPVACPLCGSEEDTLAHRLLWCQGCHEDRQQLVSHRQLEELRALDAEDPTPLGIFLHQGDLVR